MGVYVVCRLDAHEWLAPTTLRRQLPRLPRLHLRPPRPQQLCQPLCRAYGCSCRRSGRTRRGGRCSRGRRGSCRRSGWYIGAATRRPKYLVSEKPGGASSDSPLKTLRSSTTLQRDAQATTKVRRSSHRGDLTGSWLCRTLRDKIFPRCRC